ncbi:MAG: sodium:solute symporter family protein [Sulfolobales archaeon]|nr:sodium:solute symporter family protein [Sulfolobales archaeon]MCX8208538.1 sodium:solute symporter family protein [Sulfolobales archaeon]MDW8010385.1 sodium:solute symporter family protein [Sulfolobales archaeon]
MRELLLSIAIVYTIAVLGSGVYFAKKVRSFSEFLIAGRTLPLPITLGTIWATYVGGATIVGWTGAFYTFGLDWWFYGVGAICGVTVITLVWSKRVRRLGIATLPELIERRYDVRARITLAVAMVIAYLAIYVVQIIALGSVLIVLVGLPREVAYALATIAFVAIAIPGGLKGVAITDFVQAALMATGILLGGTISLYMAGGLKAWEVLPPKHLTPLGYFSPITAIGAFVSVFGIASVSQSLFIQRFAASRDERTAYLAGLMMIPGAFFAYFFGPYLMGTSARTIIGPGFKAADVFPKLVLSLPTWLGALLFATVLATIVTTANSLLISGTANVVWDLVHRLRPGLSEDYLMKLSKIIAAVLGLIGLPWAIFAPGIVDAIAFAYTIYSAVAFTPLYLAFWRRANAVGATASIIGGAITAITWEYVLLRPYGIHSMIPSILVALVLMVVGSLLTPPPPKERVEVVGLK